ncbi:MAG: phage baseplate assembly protein V [Acidobacteriia bacterium]|nr:phage baseplate assembly protein V [Terriglobia bacterium]
MSSVGIFEGAGGQAHGRMSGVAVAVVINNQDPQGLGRVQVKLPSYSDLDIGHWARVAVLMAGNQRGSFFLPEVGDEVLVAFEAGDLERPFVLGGLWNGQDNPPDTNADGKNNKRFIKSRSGHLVRLDDTDGAEKIEIIDKSGNNSITFDTANNTITITSAQDINIDASNGTIKLTAQNVSISSTADTKIEPQGGLTLQASGNTTIKGAVVNIN